MKKNLNSVAAFNLLSSLILNGIQFFTLPIYTRLLGTANYGIVSIYLTWINLATVILGLQLSGTVSIAAIHLKKDEQDQYHSSVLSLSALFFIIILAITIIFRKSLGGLLQLDPAIVVLIIIHSFFKSCVVYATSKYIYYKEAVKNFIISVGLSLLSVVLSLVLIINIKEYDLKYIGNIYGQAIPHILIGAILLIVFFAKGKTFINKKYWAFCLPLCMSLMLHSISHMIMEQSNKIMLQFYKTEEVVGVYGLAVNFGMIISVLWTAMNNTWVPFYYDDLESKNHEGLSKKTSNYLILFTVLTCGFVLLTPEVFKLFAAEDFWYGEKIVPVIALSYYFMFLYSFPVNYEFYCKKTRNIAVGTTISALINIGLNLLLIPRFSLVGAAFSSLVSHFFLFLFHHFLAKKIDSKEYFYRAKTFLPAILCVLIATGIFYIAYNLPIIRWAIGAILGVFILTKIIKQKSIF